MSRGPGVWAGSSILHGWFVLFTKYHYVLNLLETNTIVPLSDSKAWGAANALVNQGVTAGIERTTYVLAILGSVPLKKPQVFLSETRSSVVQGITALHRRRVTSLGPVTNGSSQLSKKSMHEYTFVEPYSHS